MNTDKVLIYDHASERSLPWADAWERVKTLLTDYPRYIELLAQWIRERNAGEIRAIAAKPWGVIHSKSCSCHCAGRCIECREYDRTVYAALMNLARLIEEEEE